ncbi:MAG TPA: ABC transporter permease [Chloroflexi bacterium]|nr:ABC transporter permease [Chloroflexota bacterium]
MRAVDIALKDLLQAFRSKFDLGMMVGVPLLITGILYLAFGGLSGRQAALPEFRVLVVDLDQPPAGSVDLGSALVDYLADERMPDWLIVQAAATEADAMRTLEARDAQAVVIIPPDFTAALTRPGGDAALRVLHDPTKTVGPSLLRYLLGIFTGGVTGAGQALEAAGAVFAETGIELDAVRQAVLAQGYAEWYARTQSDLNHGQNPALTFRRIDLPAGEESDLTRLLANIMAGMMVFFVFFGSVTTALSILKEDHEGTLARLFITPARKATIFSGKLAAVFLTAVVQGLILVGLSSLLFGIRWGGWPWVALALLGMAGAAAGFSLLVVAFVRDYRQAGPVIGGVLSVSGMLGGLMTAGFEGLPVAFIRINRIFPQAWALQGWRQALDSAPLADAGTTVMVSLAFGAVLFTAGWLLLRRRFA